MKIIVIENNFITDTKTGDEPFFYLKPDVSIIRNNIPVYYPEPPYRLYFNLCLVLNLNRLGKSVTKKFAPRYFNEITAGFNFFISKEGNIINAGFDNKNCLTLFDNSVQLGNYILKDNFNDLDNIELSAFVNGKELLKTNTNFLSLKTTEAIEFVSKQLTIKMGDLILLSFPFFPCELKPGDCLKASIEGLSLLDLMVK